MPLTLAQNASYSCFICAISAAIVDGSTGVFSPDSSTLAIGSWVNTVSLYDVETGELCRRRRESRSAVDAAKK